MTPEQIATLTADLIKANETSTIAIVEKTVNGGIVALRKEVAEMRDEVKGNHEFVQTHAKEDKIFQDRSSPMLEIFENNEITRLTIEKKTESWAKWAREIGIIGAFILGALAFIKTYLMN